MIKSADKIELIGMAYSAVRSNLTEDRIWQVSLLGSELGSKPKDYFKEYIKSIWNCDTKGPKPYPGVFRSKGTSKGNPNKTTKEMLDHLIELNVPSSDDDFEKFRHHTKRLSSKLVIEMNKVRAYPGVLFVIQFKFGRKTYVALLKLDLGERGISILDPKTHKINYQELENVLPDPKRLQKGAVYPTPPEPGFQYTGDILLVQTDAREEKRAKYFHDFLEVEEIFSNRKQLIRLIKTLEDLKKQLKMTLEWKDIQDIHAALTGGPPSLDSTGAQSLGHDILKANYDPTRFRKALLSKDLRHISINKNAVLNRRIKIQINGIRISVPIGAVDNVKYGKDAL